MAEIEKESEILTQVSPDIRRRAQEQWFVELNAMNIHLQKIIREMTGLGRIFQPNEALLIAHQCVINELKGLHEQIHGPSIIKASANIVQ